jgi:preprotein translocase subunit SecA
MISFLTKLLDSNNREINRFKPVIEKINSLEEKFKKLKDKDFAKKTQELRRLVKDGAELVEILPEAFALAREASSRAVNMRHFDVQLMASMTLAQGKIAEQKTGEGKTLSAIPALYLHSLTGKGVHLVTVNDYLARRDAGWMGPIFNLLGVSVSSIINNESFLFDPSFVNETAFDFRLRHLKPITRKEAYLADVTYGINSEFGFDYLRDNMAPDLEAMVQRGYYFAIVDEVDSVLIDEARTPHIISAPDEAPSQRYYEYAKVIDKLVSTTDYKIDEKFRTAHLTDHGIAKIEKLYGISDIYEKDFDTVYHLEAALKARALFHKEKDYIVKDGQVILVDEFTGRLMEGRRLSEGIHQAIEAKENVAIQRESKTLATVSLQNYFRLYERLAGMTGTAVTEAEEFRRIYKLDVIVIPTHITVKRKDLADSVYKTSRAKYTAVVAEIERAHKLGQPILVGTTSIDKNEIISQLLKRKGIKHEVLNAKNHQREAQIIADAGKINAVTIATNMAGRGVDIVLGGDTPKGKDGTPDKNSPEFKTWEKAHNAVLEAGGLYVIGTERHESRRIDNQLRGRSGRQGDPGASRFFVALDDDIMRLFGGDRIAGIMTRFNMPEDVPLEHAMVSKSIENSQVKVEGFNFDSRKHLVEYDDVLNKQREIIYKLRRGMLEKSAKGEDGLKDEITKRIHPIINSLVNASMALVENDPIITDQKIIEEFAKLIPFDEASQKQLVGQLQQTHTTEEKIAFLTKLSEDMYQKREQQLTSPLMRQIEKIVCISVIDNLWMNHLDAVENLRQGIGLRGYAQRDPLVEYKNEGYRMFEKLMWDIDDDIVHRIYRVQIHQEQPLQPLPKARANAVTNTPASEISQTSAATQKASQKISRNDPCPCGSGRKWKKCHYPNLPA